MFRPHVFRRSFSLFRRAPASAIAKSAARDSHDAVRIQRVRIRKRFFTKSRLVGTTVAAVGVWELLSWLNEEVEDDEGIHQDRRLWRSNIVEEGAKGGREITDEEEEDYDDEDDDEDDEGLLFFPTGFSRPKPRTFYRGSDPEWQEFIRLAPDRQRMDRIRGELVALVRDLAAKSPLFSMHLGKIDPNKGSIWIEVKFPDGPPIEYERPGIELTEDLTFRKATRSVDQIHHKRLADLLLPTTVANAVYLDIKRRMYASWQGLRKYAGLEESVKPSTAQGIIKGLPALPATPNPFTRTPAAPSASTSPPSPATSGDTEKQAPSPTMFSPPQNPALEKLGLSLPDPAQVPTMDLSYLRMMSRKHHKGIAVDPPRGTFIVSGLVEIIGDKAKMTLDVIAVYDPKVGKYILLNSKPRSITPYKQRPRGGP